MISKHLTFYLRIFHSFCGNIPDQVLQILYYIFPVLIKQFSYIYCKSCINLLRIWTLVKSNEKDGPLWSKVKVCAGMRITGQVCAACGNWRTEAVPGMRSAWQLRKWSSARYAYGLSAYTQPLSSGTFTLVTKKLRYTCTLCSSDVERSNSFDFLFQYHIFISSMNYYVIDFKSVPFCLFVKFYILSGCYIVFLLQFYYLLPIFYGSVSELINMQIIWGFILVTFEVFILGKLHIVTSSQWVVQYY